MSDLAGISQAAYTATSLANLILVTPARTGIQAQFGKDLQDVFLFDFEGEQSVSMDSDITDHYSETNDHLNDQIANRPVTVSTTGYIGELSDIAPEEVGRVTDIVRKLTTISAFVPELTVFALQAYNAAFQGYQVAQNIVNATEKWKNSEYQNKQQKAYAQFYSYWKNPERTLFTVQTPWAKFENMAIESLRVIQDADTEEISSFEMSFKQMRFADEYDEIKTYKVDGRLADQETQDAGVDRGVVNPSTSELSLDSILPA